jgi:hypothetical protein
MFSFLLLKSRSEGVTALFGFWGQLAVLDQK